jgi:hypothetical protein
MTPDALSHSPAALPDNATNVPPDWSTLSTELSCPLCEYNLRGLTDSRCPECGFAFTWLRTVLWVCDSSGGDTDLTKPQ